jgi:outer membrane protein
LKSSTLSVLAVAILTASFIPLRAAEPRAVRPSVLHVDLAKAIQMTLAKNFTIDVQRYSPQIARAEVTQQLGRFDPNLNFNAARSEDATRDVFNGISHFSRGSVSRGDTFSLGVSGLTPLGTNYNLSIGSSINRGLDSTATFNSFDLYEGNATLNVTQPLLRGAGTAANLAQIRIARNNALVSDWQLRQVILDIINQIVGVYNELHFAQENLRVAIGFRDLARQTLEDNIKREKFGAMAALDITTARAEAAAREETVIVAERQVKDNENFFKQLVTHDLEAILDVSVEIEPPPAPSFTANVRAGIAEALQLRPDYRSAMLDIDNRRITVVLQKNLALPRLDLQASLSLLGFDNDFGTSLNRVPRRDETAWTVGAIFSVPIPNRTGRGAVVAAQLSAAQALINLQKIEQQIVVDVDNASGQVTTARQRITSNEEASKLAKESLDAGEKRLAAGTGTTFEVLELQKKLAQALSAGLRAQADYNKAVSEYHRQTGTALRLHGVVVQ